MLQLAQSDKETLEHIFTASTTWQTRKIKVQSIQITERLANAEALQHDVHRGGHSTIAKRRELVVKRVTGSEIGRVASDARRGEDLMTKAVQENHLSQFTGYPFDKADVEPVQKRCDAIKAGACRSENWPEKGHRPPLRLLQSLRRASRVDC